MVYRAEGLDESFHIAVDIKNDVITRWAVAENITQEVQGRPGEGTSIDFDEPFVMRFECDEDGWVLKAVWSTLIGRGFALIGREPYNDEIFSCVATPTLL